MTIGPARRTAAGGLPALLVAIGGCGSARAPFDSSPKLPPVTPSAMRRRDYVARLLTPILGPALGLASGLLGCASLHRPNDVALNVLDAARESDASTGTRNAGPGVYDVVAVATGAASSNRDQLILDGCRADIGGGVRCVFTLQGCVGATLTMHLTEAPNGEYSVASAAVVGVFASVYDPERGRSAWLTGCGSAYTKVGSFAWSEKYSSELVPWTSSSQPRTRADTDLAASRLATNRDSIDVALAALSQAATLGEDPRSVVLTAAVEAAFTMGLIIATDSDRILRWRGVVPPNWDDGAGAYPTDTTLLRRGIRFLDFAAQLPGARINWSQVLTLPTGEWLANPRAPSIAALAEMNGIAHYQLGRIYMVQAAAAPSCALWTQADESLATAYSYLSRTPQDPRADPSDAHLAESAQQLTQRADSARIRACPPS
jgi:hypothetical protein